MDAAKLKRLKRERGSIKLEPGVERHRVQIVSPTVTRRPALDATLADMSVVAQFELEQMRKNSMNHIQLGEDGIRDFSRLCEQVLKQTRLEIEVEKHVDQRTAGLSREDLADSIARKLRAKGQPEGVVKDVLDAMGFTEDDIDDR